MIEYPTLEKILGKETVLGMSRGRIIVDENLLGLVPYLQEKNIRVETPDSGQKDPAIIRQKLIGNRIFVTNNSKDFKPYAAETETWIIATEGVRARLTDPDLATLVSDTLRDMKLFSKGVSGGLFITLQLGRPPLVEKIED
jgi:hypothetical protein